MYEPYLQNNRYNILGGASLLIYIVNYCLIAVYGICIKNKKKLCIIVSVQLLFLLGLRNDMLGADAVSYNYMYNLYGTYGLVDILKSIRIFSTSTFYGGKEGGFVLLMWSLSKLQLSYHSYVVIHAAFCIFSISVFIFRYSKKPWLAYEFLLALSFCDVVICLQRAALAFSILLFTVKFIKQRRLYPFLGLVLLASMFHSSALVFLIVYPMYSIPVNKNLIRSIVLGSLSLIVLTPVLYNVVIKRILTFMNRKYEISDFSWNNIFLLILMVVAYILIFEKRRSYNSSDYDDVLTLLVVLSFPVQVLAFYLSTFSRVSMHYMLPFSAGIIPNIIENNKADRRSWRFIFFILLGVYYMYFLNGDPYSIVPYHSVWEKM